MLFPADMQVVCAFGAVAVTDMTNFGVLLMTDLMQRKPVFLTKIGPKNGTASLVRRTLPISGHISGEHVSRANIRCPFLAN
jgi:hypothetical protein